MGECAGTTCPPPHGLWRAEGISRGWRDGGQAVAGGIPSGISRMPLVRKDRRPRSYGLEIPFETSLDLLQTGTERAART